MGHPLWGKQRPGSYYSRKKGATCKQLGNADTGLRPTCPPLAPPRTLVALTARVRFWKPVDSLVTEIG